MKAADRIELFRRLAELNPHPTTELEYSSPFELLIAVILSAQATDVGVNKATRRLFPIANTPQTILALGEEELKRHIATIGLFNTQAKNIIATCRIMIEQHGGEVPHARTALEALPGVGRKTANVVLNTAFGEPTIAVDTPHFPGRQPHRPGARQDRAGSGKETAAQRAQAPAQGRPPLADPARALRLQGAQARLPALRDPGSVRVQAQDASRKGVRFTSRTIIRRIPTP